MLKVGDIYKNNAGEEYTIIKINGIKDAKRCIIKFTDTGCERDVCRHIMQQGKVRDLLKPSVLGIGVLGEKYGNSKATKPTPLTARAYSVWKNMMARCYYENSPSYIKYGARGVLVADRWHNASNFLEDIQKLPGYNEELFLNGEIQLDKDASIIKVYSKETCRFLSVHDNSATYGHSKRCRATKEEFSKEYDTIKECAADLGIHPSSISEAINGHIDKVKGYKIEFV